MDIHATAPAITTNDIALKCFEKERKEVYGFKHGAPAHAADTTFDNNIVRFFKAAIGAAVTTTVTLIGENIELFGAPLVAFFTTCSWIETLDAPLNVDTLVVFTVMLPNDFIIYNVSHIPISYTSCDILARIFVTSCDILSCNTGVNQVHLNKMVKLTRN